MTILTRPAGIKIETSSPTRRSYDREAVTRSMQRPPFGTPSGLNSPDSAGENPEKTC
jgi:hypothetical protein